MTIKTTVHPRAKLDPERWQHLKNVLADALEQPSAAARSALVEDRCAHDATLLAEAEALVREAQAALEDPTDSLEDCAEHATVTLWHDESPRTGWRIGAYVVTRELGRGGMGTVYLAARADGQFEKEVAIKVLKRGTDTDEVLHRFSSERHILARLDHPNIARLLDAGTTDDGLPYFVMEYVAGAPVTRFVRDHQLSITERLTVFLKICAAVEVAHHNHVIHRDLKPSNILVNAEGEPKLLDFGIAKLLTPGEDSLEVTVAGEERLTPICASPEQTDGRPVTEASDVFALGALLYEVLTGQKPHKFSSTHPSREEIAHVISEQEPVFPSVAAGENGNARHLRGDLDAIILYALRKEPECRYPTVADLAADVRRLLERQPVRAREQSVRYRAKCLVARNRSLPRLLAGAAVVLLIGGIGLAFWLRPQSGKDDVASSAAGVPQVTDLPKSIAVLPFDNFGDNSPASYFADGVQDNILTDLGKVEDLKVISRSGVARYRGKARNVKEIGRELGVANVLQGSVQISGDRVRINAQLIDTRTDTQTWAEHYDRKVEDILALQSELAQTIVEQLKATLSSREKAAIWKRPTQDMQAYDLYLRARAAMNMHGGPDSGARWKEAVDLLTGAINRDPKFALAYCLLNEAHVYIYRFGDDHSPARLAAVKDAAETALRLEPGLEEAHLALARYYYNGLGDYRRTQEELAKLASFGAHEVEYYTLAGLVERRLGLWDETIRDSAKSVELDPQDPMLPFNLIQTLTGLKKFEESESVADAAILRLPPKAGARLWLLKNELELARGNVAGARDALEAMPAKDQWDYQLARLWIYFVERDLAGAKQFAESVSPELKKMYSFPVLLGTIAHSAGDDEEARRAFEEARTMVTTALEKRPNDPDLISELAMIDSGLGRKEDAIREAERAVELRPIAKDAVGGPMMVGTLAQVLAWTGDRDRAFELLAGLVKVPFGPNYGDLKFNPSWDELRNDPRYDRLLADAASLVPGEKAAGVKP